MADENENKGLPEPGEGLFQLADANTEVEKGMSGDVDPPEPEAGEVAEPEKAEEVEVKSEEKPDKTLEELEEVKRQNDQLLQTVESLSQKPVEPEKDSLEEMPDPALDPEGHKKWLKDEFKARDEKLKESEVRDEQREQQRKLEELEKDFDTKYPDLASAERKIIVQQATTEEIMKAGATPKARQDFVFNNREKFMERVAENTKEKLKGLGVNLEPEADPEPATRTAGVSGGTKKGGKTKLKSEPQVKSLQSELATMQTEAGWY